MLKILTVATGVAVLAAAALAAAGIAVMSLVPEVEPM